MAKCYLQHRVSVDIDLFTDIPFDRSLAAHVKQEIEKNQNIRVLNMEKIHDRFTYTLGGYGYTSLLDIVNYPFKRLERS